MKAESQISDFGESQICDSWITDLWFPLSQISDSRNQNLSQRDSDSRWKRESDSVIPDIHRSLIPAFRRLWSPHSQILWKQVSQIYDSRNHNLWQRDSDSADHWIRICDSGNQISRWKRDSDSVIPLITVSDFGITDLWFRESQIYDSGIRICECGIRFWFPHSSDSDSSLNQFLWK